MKENIKTNVIAFHNVNNNEEKKKRCIQLLQENLSFAYTYT